MYSEMNDRMKKAQQGIAHLHKIDAMLDQLKQEEETLSGKESKLKEIMEKEKEDLEKLENRSIASIFHSMLGNLDEHIEKERKEALAARLKYNQLRRDLDGVKAQISELTSERTNYLGCQNEYDDLYAQKKKELMKGADSTAQKLLELTNRTNLADISLKEISEAIDSGEKVLEGLERALGSLDRAEGWGTFDLFGGGLISDLAKHSHIDDAKAEVEATQGLLRRFKTELADIEISSDIVIEIGSFATFADFFFDGLIADWFMQSRINNSQASVSNVKAQVQTVIDKLKALESQEENKKENLEAEISSLVIGRS